MTEDSARGGNGYGVVLRGGSLQVSLTAQPHNEGTYLCTYLLYLCTKVLRYEGTWMSIQPDTSATGSFYPTIPLIA
jgi:hypothetical protein